MICSVIKLVHNVLCIISSVRVQTTVQHFEPLEYKLNLIYTCSLMEGEEEYNSTSFLKIRGV